MQCLAFKGLGVTPQMCPDSSCFNLKNVLKSDRPQVVDSCDSKSIFILYISLYTWTDILWGLILRNIFNVEFPFR